MSLSSTQLQSVYTAHRTDLTALPPDTFTSAANRTVYSAGLYCTQSDHQDDDMIVTALHCHVFVISKYMPSPVISVRFYQRSASPFYTIQGWCCYSGRLSLTDCDLSTWLTDCTFLHLIVILLEISLSLSFLLSLGWDLGVQITPNFYFCVIFSLNPGIGEWGKWKFHPFSPFL